MKTFRWWCGQRFYVRLSPSQPWRVQYRLVGDKSKTWISSWSLRRLRLYANGRHKITYVWRYPMDLEMDSFTIWVTDPTGADCKFFSKRCEGEIKKGRYIKIDLTPFSRFQDRWLDIKMEVAREVIEYLSKQSKRRKRK